MKNTPHQTILDSFRNYIGIPYEDYDCYEILKLYYKNELGKDLSDIYTVRPDKETTVEYINNEKDKFIEVDTPEFGDIIVFKVFGLACHVGMYVNETYFFHSRNATDACLEKLSIWKKRVVGYYRWP